MPDLFASLRFWRLLAAAGALALMVLGAFAFNRSSAPAAPPIVHREIPVTIEVTPPAPPPNVPQFPLPSALTPGAPPPLASDPQGGTLAFTWRRAQRDQLYALPSGATEPVRLSDGLGDDRDPAWSPDGTRLAFTSRRDQNWDVYVLTLATGALTRISHDYELDRRPNWSPDGQWVAFESYRNGNFDIYIASQDGLQTYQVTGDPSADFAPAWSPDGRYIVYTSYRSGNKDLWRIDLRNASDELAVNLTNSPARAESDAAWAPDGQALAYVDTAGDRPLVYSTTVQAGALVGTPTVLAIGARPTWSPDGRSVLALYIPENDLTQTYLIAHPARGIAAPGAAGTSAALPAYGGVMYLHAASWTRAALPPDAAQNGTAPPAAFNIGAWLGQGMTDGGPDSVIANLDVLTTVSPYWFTLDAYGNLLRYYTADDPDFIHLAHAAALRLYPTIATQSDASNARTVMSNPARRRTHINAITTRIEYFGYDGIDIDYEGMVIEDRDLFSAFIAELALTMRYAGFDTSVTVYPRTRDGRTWIGPDSNDYYALGQSADYVRIMAYEYHGAYGPSGPVGPAYWQDDVLSYAVSRVAPEKLILGLHLYGTDWGDGARAMLYNDIAATLQGTGARVYWDERAAESYFSYYGSGGQHRVWFPDARFVEARLTLARHYGIGGLCFWRLGGEDPLIWERLRAAQALR